MRNLEDNKMSYTLNMKTLWQSCNKSVRRGEEKYLLYEKNE